MQPLSPRIRVAYLLFFALVFSALLPIVILYADGWRFSSDLGVYRTGGVYVTVPYTGVVVSINGEVVGTTGLLQRSFYIDDLAPSTYVLRARREGFYPWERMVVVEPQLVTDARVILMPTELETTRIVLSGSATGTRVVSSALYNEYTAGFGVSAPASSTLPLDTLENTGLFVEDGNLYVRWMSTETPVPSIFCNRPSYCVPTIALEEEEKDTSLTAAFFEGGVVYRTKEGGVFFTEVDVRPIPRAIPVYQKANTDFRIVNGVLLVKDGTAFYEIGGL